MIRKLGILLTFLIMVGVLGSFWYVRTYMGTGNPVFPLSFVWQDEIIFQGRQDPIYRSDRFPGHHIPDELAEDLERDKWGTILEGFRDPWQYIAESSKIGGYGAVLCVVGLPCLLFTIASSFLSRRWGLVIFIACFFLSFALFPFPTWGRFSIPHLIPLLVCIGCTLEAVDGKG